ncbi:MAG: dihydrofolate reductase [Desulfuromonadales bacterium]|nr:dihydrofolate reductase [Desulfuromonadales bacterium]
MSKPLLSIIVAMDQNRLIGDHGHLPWVLPEDLQNFRQLTDGNTVIMGRKTFESLAEPLTHRHNIILSRTLPERTDAQVCRSFLDACACAWHKDRAIFFIGGTQIYQKALKIVDQMHISWVDGDFSGDCYFPEIDFDEWQIEEERKFTGFRYVRYRRKI